MLCTNGQLQILTQPLGPGLKNVYPLNSDIEICPVIEYRRVTNSNYYPNTWIPVTKMYYFDLPHYGLFMALADKRLCEKIRFIPQDHDTNVIEFRILNASGTKLVPNSVDPIVYQFASKLKCKEIVVMENVASEHGYKIILKDN